MEGDLFSIIEVLDQLLDCFYLKMEQVLDIRLWSRWFKNLLRLRLV